MRHRLRILWLLFLLDDEAFSWLAIAMLPSAMLAGARVQVWPDGVGGFRDKRTIEELRAAVRRWLDAVR